MKLTIEVLTDSFAIAKLPPTEVVPAWATGGEFSSITRTIDELSIVTMQNKVPSGAKANRGWRALKVRGAIDFSEVGVLNSIANPLARASISIFAISTFNADYILVKEEMLENAINALHSAGHTILQDR